MPSTMNELVRWTRIGEYFDPLSDELCEWWTDDTTIKPNIRKMFVPDAGFTIFEVDLKQGDAQVVAWEANDLKLMEVFEKQQRGELIDGKPIDIHSQNAKDIFPDVVLDAKGKAPHQIRQISKSGVHATNYKGHYVEVAHRLGVKPVQMKNFQTRWYFAHPAIPAWHSKVELDLMEKGYIVNIFGYRKFFFGRPRDDVKKALAWNPQSTVALVINRGILNLRRKYPFIHRLLQVHDSFIGQCPTPLFTPDIQSGIKSCFLIPLPYPRPLTIGVDLKSSVISWGDCE